MKKHLLCIIALVLIALGTQPTQAAGRRERKAARTDSVVSRIFGYAQQVDTVGRGNHPSYAYTKFQMRTNKRNASLMLVPTMYAISHGISRKFICEYYNRLVVDDKGKPNIKRLLNLSTVPHRRSTMTSMLDYMTPSIYGENLFEKNILSPFHRTNRRYYRYYVTLLPYGMAQVYAYPKIKNTQLVETRAIVNAHTGQIQLCDFEGEYDMTRFFISVAMGKEGFKTLGPIKCEMRANFKFMGNNITGKYTTLYDLPPLLGDSVREDSLDNAPDTLLMARVRPIPLSTDEEMMYRHFYEAHEKHHEASVREKAKASGEKEASEEKKVCEETKEALEEKKVCEETKEASEEKKVCEETKEAWEEKKEASEEKKKDSEEEEEGKNEKSDFVKDVLWDVVGDNLLNRISSGFGKQQQGYFRIDPLFNPLYMGYSKKKGVVYKFKLRGDYAFTPNWKVEAGFKGGYSFRQHRFYFNVPLKLTYNTPHEGYLLAEIGNGNRINTNRVARQALGYQEPKDSVGSFSPAELPAVLEGGTEYTEFKDNYFKLINHWRFNPKWAVEFGLVSHNRIAVKPEFYQAIGYPDKYKSVAPSMGVEWRPRGEKGAIMKLNYEQGIKKLLGGNISYGRTEFDVQAIRYASRRRSYSLRGGMGAYTHRTNHWDFVDYSNFHDNNIPGGWNDEWTGDFELLSSQWYNASDYYVRGNFTYEAPMVLSAWLPLVGRFIEKERFYISALAVKHLHPYTEWGYGISSRLISLGFFAAFREAKFDGVGCRFGFELFRNW